MGRVVRGWRGARHRVTDICRTSILGRCKGPKVGVCLARFRNRDWCGWREPARAKRAEGESQEAAAGGAGRG